MKYIFITLNLAGDGVAVGDSKTIDSQYKKIKSFCIVCPDMYPTAPAMITKFAIEGKSEYIESGLFVGALQTGDKPEYIEINRELNSDRKIEVEVKDLKNGVPFSMQFVFIVE